MFFDVRLTDHSEIRCSWVIVKNGKYSNWGYGPPCRSFAHEEHSRILLQAVQKHAVWPKKVKQW